MGDDHSDVVVVIGIPRPSTSDVSSRRLCCWNLRSTTLYERHIPKAATLTVAITSENVSRKDAVP